MSGLKDFLLKREKEKITYELLRIPYQNDFVDMALYVIEHANEFDKGYYVFNSTKGATAGSSVAVKVDKKGKKITGFGVMLDEMDTEIEGKHFIYGYKCNLSGESGDVMSIEDYEMFEDEVKPYTFKALRALTDEGVQILFEINQAAEDEEGNHAPYSHSDQLMNASKDDLVEEFEKHEIFKEGANYMKQYLDYMKEQEQEVVAQA